MESMHLMMRVSRAKERVTAIGLTAPGGAALPPIPWAACSILLRRSMIKARYWLQGNGGRRVWPLPVRKI